MIKGNLSMKWKVHIRVETGVLAVQIIVFKANFAVSFYILELFLN